MGGLIFLTRRRGRPKKPNAKRHGLRIRLNEDELYILSELSRKTGKSRSDIFMQLMADEYRKIFGKETI